MDLKTVKKVLALFDKEDVKYINLNIVNEHETKKENDKILVKKIGDNNDNRGK